MDTIKFSIMADLENRDSVAAMMREFNEEDRAVFAIDQTRFASSIEQLIADASAGQIVLFLDGSELRGYAVVVPYWSNELGGRLLFVDELFVVPEFRSRGIGRRFFNYVERQLPFGIVGLGLGVNPQNRRARRFYESLGFVELQVATFVLRI
jgi:GNAT superfamily N-acetyltransferase